MKKISVIVSCFNEEKALPIFYKKIEEVRIRDFFDTDFEYIFIDDGSKDKTLEIIKDLALKDEKVRYISFSRNFGKEAAMLAGLDYSTGDYVTLMDADMQDPPSLLIQMYDIIKNEDYDSWKGKDSTKSCRADKKWMQHLSGFWNDDSFAGPNASGVSESDRRHA